MVANRFQLFHHSIIRAYLDLSNPNKTVKKPLLKGQAAGQLQLIHAQFPPEGYHHTEVPARFTFDFEMEWRTSFELHLMVQLVDNGEGGNNFVLGHINHGQWRRLSNELPSQAESVNFQERWVGVKYSPVRREGHAFLSKNLYKLLLETGLE